MSKTYIATVNSTIRGKAFVVIGVFLILALFSLIMSIYDLASGMTFYGILFGLAAIIFIALMLLKVNAAFGTYLKLKQGTLYMKSWVTDFLPYQNGKGFFSDLKPSKTKLSKIPSADITAIFIGTKDFIKRNATNAGKRLMKALYPYEHSSNKARRKSIESIDIFYLETVDNECCFMSVEGFDEKKIVDIIGSLYKNDPDLYVKVNSRQYRKYIKRL